MFATVKETIEKYGRDKNYIFFRVSESRFSTQITILGHYTDGKLYDYSDFDESHPVNLVSALGISETEAKFYRPIEVTGEEIEVLENADIKSLLDISVDFSFKQDETNDGRTVNFQRDTYAMLGSVKDEYYDVFVTRYGFARVKACTYEAAYEKSYELKEDDFSWSESLEVELSAD